MNVVMAFLPERVAQKVGGSLPAKNQKYLCLTALKWLALTLNINTGVQFQR
jgi:hypothetical protein